jgi:predicted transcriptional regulator
VKLREVKELLDAQLLVGEDSLDLKVDTVCGADLLSDVLAFTKPGSLLLTGLTHPQVIRTAEIAEIMAVCFVRGKRPSEQTVELAKEKRIPVLCTSLPMYESCGYLYNRQLSNGSGTETK